MPDPPLSVARAAPAGDTPTDGELLARSALGDQAAFEEFVDRHRAFLHRYLRTFADPQEAEEALQDAFVSAWHAAGGFARDRAARPWLAAIARNAHRRRFRRRVGEPARLATLDDLATEAGWGAVQPDDLERLVTRDTLEWALARLPDDEREVLVLRDLEEFSGEETAALLDLSLAAMKSRLHRARLHLAAAVRPLAGEGA